jgi:hypothetical protein
MIAFARAEHFREISRPQKFYLFRTCGEGIAVLRHQGSGFRSLLPQWRSRDVPPVKAAHPFSLWLECDSRGPQVADDLDGGKANARRASGNEYESPFFDVRDRDEPAVGR